MLMRLRRFRTSCSRPRRKRPPHPLLPRLSADVRGCCPLRAEIVTSTIMQRPCLTASRPSGVGKRVRTPPSSPASSLTNRKPSPAELFALSFQWRFFRGACSWREGAKIPFRSGAMRPTFTISDELRRATSSSCDSAQPQWSDQRAGARPGLRAKWRHPLLLVSARRHPPVRHTDENKMLSRASYARSGSNANHAVAT